MQLRNFVEEKLSDFEFYVSETLLDIIPERELGIGIMLALNAIMFAFSSNYIRIFALPGMIILPFLILLSISNTYNFFTQYKTYQLLDAAIDEKRQSIFQPVTMENSNQPLLSEKNYRMNRYPLRTRSRNLQIRKLEQPTVQEDPHLHDSAQERNASGTLDLLKKIFSMYVSYS